MSFNFPLLKQQTYLFNVESKSVFNFNKNAENEIFISSTTPETTLNDLLQDTAAQLANDGLKKRDEIGSATEKSITKSSIRNEFTPEPKGKRRGVWKRIRVRPLDSFEAAESQNIGNHLYNALNDKAKEFGERYSNKPRDEIKIFSELFLENETTPEWHDDQSTVSSPVLLDDNERFTEIPSISDDNSTEEEIVNATTVSNDVERTTILPDITTNINLFSDDANENSEELTTYFDQLIDFTSTVVPFLSLNQSDAVDEPIGTEKFITQPESDDSLSKEDNKGDKEEEEKENEDQEPQSSRIMDEVKQKLTELFSFENDDVVVSTTERVFRINRNFKRPKPAIPFYTTIERNQAPNEIGSDDIKDIGKSNKKLTSVSMKLAPVPILKTILKPVTEPSSFHKDLMESVIYATSTSTEISHETEICYRGRCVKTQKKP